MPSNSGHPLFAKRGAKTPKVEPETVGFLAHGTGGDHSWFASKGSTPSEDGKWFRDRAEAMRWLGNGSAGDLGEIPHGYSGKRIIKRQYT